MSGNDKVLQWLGRRPCTGELQVRRLWEGFWRTVKLLGGPHSSGISLNWGRNVLGFQQRFNLSCSVVKLLGDCAISAAF